MVADIEKLGKLDASEIHARRLNAEAGLTRQEGEHFIVPIADGLAKLFGNHEVRESTLKRDQPVMSADLREELTGNSEMSQPTEKSTLKPAMILVN